MKQLSGQRRADAAIVGGGLTGLLLGASLSREGLRVAVVDAENGTCPPPWEAATLPCGRTLSQIYALHGLEKTQQYASSLQTQLRALLEASLPYVHREAAYTYAHHAADLPSLERMHDLCTHLQLPVHIAPDAGGCPFPVELSLFSQAAVIDMPRWMAALSASIRRNGGQIYRSSRVITLDGQRVHTAKGTLTAPVIILTTGKPLGLRDSSLLTLLESRTTAHCVMASDIPLHSVQQSIDCGLSLCPTRTGVIVTMDIGRTGSREQAAGIGHFVHTLGRLLPGWQGEDILCTQHVHSADGLPFIGMLPGQRLLFAAGFGSCGILGAMHAAEVLTRRIFGRALPEDALYAPDRTLPQGLLRREKRRLLAISMAGLLHPQSPVCSHCRCRTRYFSHASQWGCPLCGTVYDCIGLPISGPGMTPIRVSPRQRRY